MLPLQTAYKNYDYNTCFVDKKNNTIDLITFTKELHKYNSQQNNWKNYDLKIGSFGFDCLATSICYAIEAIYNMEKINVDKLSNIIHRAWCDIYIYWRDNKPWLDNKYYIYQKPSKPLGDKRRNTLSITKYDDLIEDEKEKSRLIAKFILNYIG
jgi:hypothetical protein